MILIVGGRCSGASLALILAAEGLEVTVIERSEVLGWTPSTHFIWPDGCDRLRRWGILDRLMGVSPPFITRFDGDMAGRRVRAEMLGHEVATCITREALDSALLDAAREAGANVLTGRRVIDVEWDRRKVRGVVVKDQSGALHSIQGDLVVGADGAGSAVAHCVGARQYHVRPAVHSTYWSYLDNHSNVDTLSFAHDGPTRILTSPADGGKRLVAVATAAMPRRISDAVFLQLLNGYGNIREAVALRGGADTFAIKVYRVGPRHTFYRRAAGPGWVLIGDAGFFKDPLTGRGISDALWQSETLASRLCKGRRRPASTRWWMARDVHEAHYAAQTEQLGEPTTTELERVAVDLVIARGRTTDMLSISSRQRHPTSVFTPSIMLRAYLTACRRAGLSPGTRSLARATARQLRGWLLPLEGGAVRLRRRTRRSSTDCARERV